MNEQLTMLIQLQEIDGRIRVQQGERQRIPGQLAELEQRAAANKAAFESTREALEQAQKSKRERDGDLEEGGRKVEKLKARTSEIKTNKEYTAHLKEIEAAEQESKKIEDDILKLMESIEAAAAAIKAAEQKLNDESGTIEADRKELEAAVVRIDAELAREQQERAALASRIDHAVLAEYQRLIGIAGGRIVVEARGESCAGCHMRIPPRTFVTVKKNDSIVGCPNCHRILYFKEVLAPPVP